MSGRDGVNTLTEHVWRTSDGRLVKGGHPDAAILAYTRGEEFNDHEWSNLGLADLFADPVSPKASKAHADKASTQHEDK